MINEVAIAVNELNLRGVRHSMIIDLSELPECLDAALLDDGHLVL